MAKVELKNRLDRIERATGGHREMSLEEVLAELRALDARLGPIDFDDSSGSPELQKLTRQLKELHERLALA
jgi:hypothetical protein